MSSPNLESLTNELSKLGAHFKRSFGDTEIRNSIVYICSAAPHRIILTVVRFLITEPFYPLKSITVTRFIYTFLISF